MSEHGFNSSKESREKSLKIICKSPSENKEFISFFKLLGVCNTSTETEENILKFTVRINLKGHHRTSDKNVG